MRPYFKEDIENIYGDFIRSAHKNYAKNRWKDALKDIMTAANWAYNFNHIYSDPEAEQLVKSIAEAQIDSMHISSPCTNRCVLMDSFLSDNRGLSQQYLRAMMSNDMECTQTKGGQ